MRSEIDEAAALKESCPMCGAGPKRPCRDRRGNPCATHEARGKKPDKEPGQQQQAEQLGQQARPEGQQEGDRPKEEIVSVPPPANEPHRPLMGLSPKNHPWTAGQRPALEDEDEDEGNGPKEDDEAADPEDEPQETEPAPEPKKPGRRRN